MYYSFYFCLRQKRNSLTASLPFLYLYAMKHPIILLLLLFFCGNLLQAQNPAEENQEIKNQESQTKTLHGIYIASGYSHLGHKFSNQYQNILNQGNYKVTQASVIRLELGFSTETPLSNSLFFNNYLGLSRYRQSFIISSDFNDKMFEYNSLNIIGISEFAGYGIKLFKWLRLSVLAGVNLSILRKTKVSACYGIWACGEESYSTGMSLTKSNLDIYSGLGFDIPLQKSKLGIAYSYNWIGVEEKMTQSFIGPDKITEHLFTFRCTIWLN